MAVMEDLPVFAGAEFDDRIERVRGEMARLDLEGLVVATPENIFYLTGLDHQGFFALHLLIVPREGRLTLIARAMEEVTVRDQVRNAGFIGYRDGDDPARVAADALRAAGLASGRLGIEKNSLFFSPRICEALLAALPQAAWRDASRLIDELRLVKSPHEIEYTRTAAAITDKM